MASFDIPSDRRGLVVMAKVAEQCERYDEMLVCLKRLIATPPVGVLTLEEKNLLSVAYKNVVGARRAPWRTLHGFEQKSKNDAVVQFKSRMETEIAEICNDIFELLTDKLIPNAPDDESRVFYYKLKADYHRYFVEVLEPSTDAATKQRAAAREAYESAIKHAASLPVESPTVLGLKLNFSVFQYEIEKEQHAGYDLAKSTFTEAYERLDALEDEDYRESATIMSLLRDNLGTWAETLGIREEGADDGMAMEDC